MKPMLMRIYMSKNMTHGPLMSKPRIELGTLRV